MKLDRHAHDDRDHRSGKFRKTELCDACGKRVGTAYFTDTDVCGSTDGPGFFLCDRKRCMAKRDGLDEAARRALYTAQRAINDAPPKLVAKPKAEPDAECTVCDERFWSADGHPRLAICKSCNEDPS